MPDEPISEDVKLKWYNYGEQDFQGAKILSREGGFSVTILFLVEQGVEKYLKGFLLSKGWKLKKTHDLELLVTEASYYNSSLKEFLDLSRILTAFYIKERYPPDIPLGNPQEETSSLIKQAEELIARIRDSK
jgi:HEPN domain-containing protein